MQAVQQAKGEQDARRGGHAAHQEAFNSVRSSLLGRVEDRLLALKLGHVYPEA